MYRLFTLTKNTFIETLRQPVYAIIIIAALLLFFISPSLTMYTMSDDDKLLRELGLSTLFLTSLFIAIFSASGAVAEEIEDKTIMQICAFCHKERQVPVDKIICVSENAIIDSREPITCQLPPCDCGAVEFLVNEEHQKLMPNDETGGHREMVNRVFEEMG